MSISLLAVLLGCPSPVAVTPVEGDTDTDTDVDTDTDTDADTDTDTDADSDTDADTADTSGPPEPWVAIPAGAFVMGSPVGTGLDNERPTHVVSMPAFEMMRREVTLEEYSACEAVGQCTPRPAQGNCLTGASPTMPANCIDWFMAGEVCSFLGGRLPSESEWEYVARSGGMDVEYPWGDAPPDCTRANLNQDNGWSSCNASGLWEVCTHPAGDTAWGMCDMGGNVFEWLADWHNQYDIHPADGSPQTQQLNYFRGMRGGSVGSDVPPRTRQRTFHEPEFYFSGMGVRCARD